MVQNIEIMFSNKDRSVDVQMFRSVATLSLVVQRNMAPTPRALHGETCETDHLA